MIIEPQREPGKPANPDPSELPNAERAVSHRRTRVLLSDDDTDTLTTLATLLQCEGFEVKMVLNGQPVPVVVEYYRPDAVFLDIGMPDRTGYSVAQELRACYGDKCPVLIALTGRAGEAEKLRSQQCGFDYHFTKPYDPVELLAFLASLSAKA